MTQLSHRLTEHFTFWGVAETGILVLAVNRMWSNISWVTRRLDPDAVILQLLMFALKPTGFAVLKTAPAALEQNGLIFAPAFVSVHPGRCLFVLCTL
jgi:low temperature requirement protein LtrA